MSETMSKTKSMILEEGATALSRVYQLSNRGKLPEMTSAFLAAVAAALVFAVAGAPKITIKNQCGFDVWVAQEPNNDPKDPNKQYKPIPGTGVAASGRLTNGQTATYTIPSGGWGGRFWPKTGCASDGTNCESGSSKTGCPSDGCQPPAETKVEFFYKPLSNTADRPYYDISLVDGYSIPMRIKPDKTGGSSCVQTDCRVSLDSCPQNEIDGLGDLRVFRNSKVVMCLSPCKKWNYPSPYGKGQPETVHPGLHLCCPDKQVSSEQCRAGNVVNTNYVKLIHQQCPTAYAYAFDDVQGSHDCPAGVSFAVTFCP